MNNAIDLLRCVLIVSFIYGAAIFAVLVSFNSKLSNITKLYKGQNLCNKELAYTMVCLGKKPDHGYAKWFTVNKLYTVYKQDELYPLVYDDDGTEWRVFQYDKLMLEAGGYLFAQVTEVKSDGN